MSSQYILKLDEDLKKAFLSSCKSNNSDAAKEIRKFITDYVNKNSQQDLFKKSKML